MNMEIFKKKKVYLSKIYSLKFPPFLFLSVTKQNLLVKSGKDNAISICLFLSKMKQCSQCFYKKEEIKQK